MILPEEHIKIKDKQLIFRKQTKKKTSGFVQCSVAVSKYIKSFGLSPEPRRECN